MAFTKTPTFTPHFHLLNPQQALQVLIDAIRKGHGTTMHWALRQYLKCLSLYKLPDVLYAKEIPFDVRRMWRHLAKDPESANEVIEYLLRQGSNPMLLLDWASEHGQEIPFSVRQRWREAGIDPESDNEVSEFRQRLGHLTAPELEHKSTGLSLR
ncbi:MAG: hypothetical protein AB7V32_02965 [Candidatus Berkiella sp.]